MKKKYLYVSDKGKWDSLVKKFIKLYKRIETGSNSKTQLYRLTRKLQILYKQLEKLQHSVGIKLAGTALAFMLTTAITYSQTYNYTFTGNLIGYPTIIDVGDSASPEYADIDGDNDLDLYVGNSLGNIAVFKNDGSWNFTFDGFLQANGTDIQVTYDSSPIFADLDKDGDLDLYVGQMGEEEVSDGRIKVYTNDGSGNFEDAGYLTAGGTTINLDRNSNPEFADIDKDGDLDLYVGSYQGTISIFTNDGSGNLSPAGFMQAGGTNIDVGDYASPSIDDVDDDGDLDLYVGEADGYFRIFLNDGSGNFSSAGILQADGEDLDCGYMSSITFANIDDDGDLDLVVGTSTGNIRTFENDGSENFSSIEFLKAHGTEISVGYFAKPEFADIDKDGDFDLFVGNYYGTIDFFRNDGSGKLSSEGFLKADGFEILEPYGTTPAVADVDGDGDLDLFVGTKYGELKVFINDGSGNFSAAGDFLADGVAPNLAESVVMDFADLDKDNDQDLYVGHDYYVQTFLNDGSGNFSADGYLQADGTDIKVGDGDFSAPAFADIDKDGDLDLYVGHCEGINVFLNDGSGVFSKAGKVHVDNFDILYYNCPTPELADLDDDGDPEMYVGSLVGFIHKMDFTGVNNIDNTISDSDISVYPNPSKGIFTIEADSYYDIEVFDLSGRKIMDNSDATKNLPLQHTLDLSNQPPGIYFIRFQNAKTVQTEKIVIE